MRLGARRAGIQVRAEATPRRGQPQCEPRKTAPLSTYCAVRFTPSEQPASLMVCRLNLAGCELASEEVPSTVLRVTDLKYLCPAPVACAHRNHVNGIFPFLNNFSSAGNRMFSVTRASANKKETGAFCGLVSYRRALFVFFPPNFLHRCHVSSFLVNPCRSVLCGVPSSESTHVFFPPASVSPLSNAVCRPVLQPAGTSMSAGRVEEPLSVTRLTGASEYVRLVIFLAEYKLDLAACHDGNLRVYDIDSAGEPRAIFKTSRSCLSTTACDPPEPV